MHPAPEKAAGVEIELPLLMVQVLKAMLMELGQGDEPQHHGMTPVHSLAVRYLAGHDLVTTVELAEHLRVTKQSASEIVAALERAGAVERRPHPHDGRARVLELTDVGRMGLDRSRERWEAVRRDWEDLVDDEDLTVVRRCLDRYLEAHPPA